MVAKLGSDYQVRLRLPLDHTCATQPCRSFVRAFIQAFACLFGCQPQPSGTSSLSATRLLAAQTIRTTGILTTGHGSISQAVHQLHSDHEPAHVNAACCACDPARMRLHPMFHPLSMAPGLQAAVAALH